MKIFKTDLCHFSQFVLPLGIQGENLARQVVIEVGTYDGYWALNVQAPNGIVYPAAIREENGCVVWSITKGDTAVSGAGKAELILYGDEGQIIKSATAKTLVHVSLPQPSGEMPDPVQTWLDAAYAVLDDLKQAGAGNVGAVRYDQPQNLTEAQKAQARENIGAGTGNGTEGDALPPVTESDNGKVLMVQDGEWTAAELPTYDGTYEVKPLAGEQTRLLTAQKFMTDNVTVKEIPYFETSNQSGSTVYIGTEVEIYGD